MAQIPLGQKFHTLNANTPTKERGSAQADGLREIYTMQDIIDSVTTGGGIDFIELGDTPDNYTGAAGQAAIVNDTEDGLIFGPAGGNVTVEAKLLGSVTNGSRMRFFSGYDAVDGVMTVTGSNAGVKIGDYSAVGIALSGSSGDIVDLAVEGTFDNFKFTVPVGGTPTLGDLLYSGNGAQNEQIGTSQILGQGTFVVGRVISTPTLVQSFPGFYDVYESTVFVKMPTLGAFFADDTNYFQSTRTYAAGESGTVEQGEIVKVVQTGSSVNISRWDASAGDTFVDIVGVTTTTFESSLSASEICVAGEVRLPTSLVGGAAATVGSVIYSDATNSYELTTDPTTGIKIGVVLEIEAIGDLIIGVNPSASGGSTTGEDLSLNVRTNPYSIAGDHEGTVLSIGTLGLTAGTVYLWDGSGEWANANAGAAATADGLMGVSTDTASAPDVLVSGIIQLASVPGSAGDVLYLDTTNGTLTATAPSGSGEIVRVMGYNLDGNRIYFNPSQDWLEIV